MDETNRSKILGLRIMQRRKQLGITQSELAETIGVSDNQISNIENGKSLPRMKGFIDICNALDCNADYLFSGIIKKNVDENIVDMIASCSLEEQKVIWKFIDCYIHREES